MPVRWHACHFPPRDQVACLATADAARDPPTASLMRFYCAQHWDVPKITARIAEAGAWGQRHHVTVIVGEFGATQRLNAPARLAWLTAVREACERQAIGWALWGYDNSMGFALRPPAEHRRLDPALLEALGLSSSSSREESPALPAVAIVP